jgi:hypothetical protein
LQQPSIITQSFTFIVFLLLFSGSTISQTNQLTITYIGNCGLHITDGETHIYTDFPYKSGAHHYAEYDAAQLDSIKENPYFIFTHKHSDHYYKGKVNKILKEKNGSKYGKWNIPALEKLGDSIPDFKIEAFKTKHRFSFSHYSYLITWHGKKIYLSGDTESAETILEMTDLEWAFIPAWLILDIQDSDKKFDTNMIGIYHIGPGDDVNITGDKVLMLKKQGEVITIPF